jgi:protein subunit release factor B
MTVGLTTSGIIVHHMPSGLGVSCDSERSQHANKEKALKMLALIVEQQTPQVDEFARLMAQATALCPELIPTPVLMNTPTPMSNRTMGHKVNMIKEVREKAGCGLKEAKEAVDEVFEYSNSFDDVVLKATLWAMSR